MEIIYRHTRVIVIDIDNNNKSTLSISIWSDYFIVYIGEVPLSKQSVFSIFTGQFLRAYALFYQNLYIKIF